MSVDEGVRNRVYCLEQCRRSAADDHGADSGYESCGQVMEYRYIYISDELGPIILLLDETDVAGEV